MNLTIQLLTLIQPKVSSPASPPRDRWDKFDCLAWAAVMLIGLLNLMLVSVIAVRLLILSNYYTTGFTNEHFHCHLNVRLTSWLDHGNSWHQHGIACRRCGAERGGDRRGEWDGCVEGAEEEEEEESSGVVRDRLKRMRIAFHEKKNKTRMHTAMKLPMMTPSRFLFVPIRWISPFTPGTIPATSSALLRIRSSCSL